MEKVKVSKEVAEVIESAKMRYEYKGDGYILHQHYEAINPWSEEYTPLNSLSFRELAIALYVGYEVEQTREDKVKDYVTRLRNIRNHAHTLPEDVQRINAEIGGITQTLEYLNIEIKGVNE